MMFFYYVFISYSILYFTLHKTISSIIYIADICEKHREKIKLFRKIVDSITNEVRYVKYFIEYIVDFSSKRSENDFIVRANVDSHLDKCKLILICFAEFE